MTGTNGKTTTAFLLYVDPRGRRPAGRALVTTIETRVGGERRPAVRTTPEAIDLQRTFREMLDAGNRSCAMEATSHGSALGRLDRRPVRRARRSRTSSRDHLDFHGTMERYFEAKRRLFVEGLPPAAVNVGDEYGRRLADELRGRVPLLTFGLVPGADVRADELELTRDGARFRIGDLELRTHLRGRFNVHNVLAAAAAARLLEVDDDAIAAGIASRRRRARALRARRRGAAVHRARRLRPHAGLARRGAAGGPRADGRAASSCVFGAGGDRDREKRPVMGRIGDELADVVVVTSDNPRNEEPQAIVDEILAGAVGEAEVEPDRRAAISTRARAGGAGRRRRDRRQGSRAGPGGRRRDAALRRPRGGARRAPRTPTGWEPRLGGRT